MPWRKVAAFALGGALGVVATFVVSLSEWPGFDPNQAGRTSNAVVVEVQPLMGLYFTFDLDAVARRSLYLDRLDGSETASDVLHRIEVFREGIDPRPRTSIPH